MTRFKYSLLFAALLPVYAQADVSVSDDPKPQESTELPTITVTADRTASSNDGYTVSGTHTPLGLPMTLREIPQSVSVITSPKSLTRRNWNPWRLMISGCQYSLMAERCCFRLMVSFCMGFSYGLGGLRCGLSFWLRCRLLSVGGVVTEVLSTLMQACGLLPSP